MYSQFSKLNEKTKGKKSIQNAKRLSTQSFFLPYNSEIEWQQGYIYCMVTIACVLHSDSVVADKARGDLGIF